MKKYLAVGLCVIVLAALLSGCLEDKSPYIPTGDGLYVDNITSATKPTAGNVEQLFSLTYYPEKSLNPFAASDYTNRVLLPLMYQSLFQVHSDYSVVPILCSRFSTSRDGKVYTFYMEKATFSDGTLLTAADVVASLKAAKQSQLYSGRLGYVSEIAATADGGVEIRLTTAYENLPILLDIPIVKAAEVDAALPLGTGPYYLEDGVAGVRLVKRTDWWCKTDLAVKAAFIPLVEAQSNAQIRDNFEFGKLGLVCADPGSDLYVDYHNDYELWDCENHVFLYLGCNEKSPVFSKQALRQALTYVINRSYLAETFYRGFAQPTTVPASPNSPYYPKNLADNYPYDAQRFADAVINAGLTDPSVTILVNKSDSRRVRVAREIAQMLTDSGLPATTSELSGNNYTKALKNGKYDLHLGQTVLSPNMDLSAFFDPKGALSYGGMSDAAILAICREALANSGNYLTMYQMILEDAVLCPVLVRSYAIYTQRGLFPDFSPARDNLFCYSLGKTLEDVYVA